MADWRWLARRLRAMGPAEIAWRVQQKLLQIAEERKFRGKRAVTAAVFYPARVGGAEAASSEHFFPEKLCLVRKIAEGGTDGALHTAIPLPAPYRYEDYKTRWHAGFQTENEWPLIPSARLNFRGMDAVGDARTNWELNKHFQFALLAKNYCASGERRFLDELIALFHDWNDRNPFLWGISWTSGIEIAERTMNWCYMLGFLAMSPDVPETFLSEARTGIVNMADWLFHHYSRYSSANNHLIIEVSAVLHAGILTGNRRWIDRATAILTRELFLQDYADGVNKEEALYYQAFMMEAYGLDLRLLEKNGEKAGETARWLPLLQRMTRYVRTCAGKYGEVVEFGDNDDGKLLDFSGCADGESGTDGGLAHYRYLLQMMSALLPERYEIAGTGAAAGNARESAPGAWSGTVRWLFSAEELARAAEKPVFAPAGSADYAEGGNAILRDADGEVLIGIDHAPLGYGALCAHGHADALSFVAFVGGKPFLCDPGTYIYHTDEEARNDFRRTARHNTVCIGGADQSEMLGAFLWGRRANCRLLRADLSGARDVIEAEHDGYAPYLHRRRFTFDKPAGTLTIEDTTGGAPDAVFHLLFAGRVRAVPAAGGEWRCEDRADGHVIGTVTFASGFGEATLADREISPAYGMREKTTGLRAPILSEPAVCVIRFGEPRETAASGGCACLGQQRAAAKE